MTTPWCVPRCPSQLCQAVQAPSADGSGNGGRDVAGCAQHCLAAAGIRAQPRDCAGDVRRCFEISPSPMPFDLKRILRGARTPSPPRARSCCLLPAQSWGVQHPGVGVPSSSSDSVCTNTLLLRPSLPGVGALLTDAPHGAPCVAEKGVWRESLLHPRDPQLSGAFV